MRKLFLLSIITLIWCSTIYGQTIHLISFATTFDQQIGIATDISQKNVTEKIKDIAFEIEIPVKEYIYNGNQCTKENLIRVINELETKPSDVILYISHSHGFRFIETETPWPYLYLVPNSSAVTSNPINYTAELKEEIFDKLKAKEHRLLICIAEACNRTLGNKPLADSQYNRSYARGGNLDGYKKLFIEAKGEFLLSSAKPEEISWSDRELGGWYTYAFLQALDTEIMRGSDANWNNLMDKSIKITKEVSQIGLVDIPKRQKRNPDTGKVYTVQTPHYMVAEEGH